MDPSLTDPFCVQLRYKCIYYYVRGNIKFSPIFTPENPILKPLHFYFIFVYMRMMASMIIISLFRVITIIIIIFIKTYDVRCDSILFRYSVSVLLQQKVPITAYYPNTTNVKSIVCPISVFIANVFQMIEEINVEILFVGNISCVFYAQSI